MTGTDVREALKAVAAATRAPAPDHLELRRRVRKERRRWLAGIVTIGAAAAAVTALGAVVVTSLPDEHQEGLPALTRPLGGAVDLEAPVHLVADGALVAVDPQGARHDLGPAEDVVGWTSEFVLYLDPDSRLVRRDLSWSEEGPGGWRWSAPVPVREQAVQGAVLSTDGRFLGWLDLAGRLHTLDLKAGSESAPVEQPPNTGLVDVAQGSGVPLVSRDGRLLLLTEPTPVAVPTVGDGYGVASTARRDLVAVVDRDDVTRLYDVSSGGAELVDSVPGTGVLSPYGESLVTISHERRDVATATLWTAGGEPAALRVPGTPQSVGWADDDTVVVSTAHEQSEQVYACEVGDPGGCQLLVEAAGQVRLRR